MPNYEIRYLDFEGACVGTLTTPCASEKDAKILAHAMRLPGTKRMEVWRGAELIYERPQRQRVLAADAARIRAALYSAGA
ncbi:MAG: hypothetical protein KGR48_13415 [Alphaproteobacteria bacterium]|nr:hypothetical protein [Alphaproteobacteria bacterium]MBU6472127.1 hypothetical protein [Alphaproteobacteria bacterium]MDE2014618.1 hypothetical protein [Alphaproteobacteria bacterium]MDE2074830.1 hypothetical protein [Alphaproteobacteria bacterium]MDE2351192.1 hypothetical protein [Alphaproteobacteria bacterium]